ncbi:MAG: hypothetical protein ACK4MD_03695 [Demequina sp.]
MNVETIAITIERGCDAAEREITRVVAAAPGIIDAALDSVRVGWPIAVPLPGPAKDGIRWALMQAVDEAARVMLEAIALFRDLARSVGRPTKLRAASATLIASVKDQASTLEGAMTATALVATSSSSWESDATDSYNEAYRQHSLAVGDIGAVAQQMSDSLTSLAGSIEQFFSDLQFAYASFAVSVASFAVAIATAAPTLGVGTIIGLVLGVISLITGIVSLINVFTGSSSRNTATAERLASSDAVAWPTVAFAP